MKGQICKFQQIQEIGLYGICEEESLGARLEPEPERK